MQDDYKLLIMLRGGIPAADTDKIVNKITNLMNSSKCKIGKIDKKGEIKLQFKIKKEDKANYFAISFNAPTQFIAELNRVLKIEDNVLRFSINKSEFCKEEAITE